MAAYPSINVGDDAEGATHIALRIASRRQREQLDLVLEKVLPMLSA